MPPSFNWTNLKTDCIKVENNFDYRITTCPVVCSPSAPSLRSRPMVGVFVGMNFRRTWGGRSCRWAKKDSKTGVGLLVGPAILVGEEDPWTSKSSAWGWRSSPPSVSPYYLCPLPVDAAQHTQARRPVVPHGCRRSCHEPWRWP
jgi:hypothetical protein